MLRASAANVIASLLLVASAGAQIRADSPRGKCDAPREALRQAVGHVHEKQRNVGLAAVVLRGGEVSFSDYMGLADFEHEVPVGPETRFGIASVTKLVTAVTLLKLRTAGQIDLDAPVQKHVPSFPRKAEGEITIGMLVTHRSGIPHPENRTPKLFATHYATATEALEVFRDDPLVAAPGSKRIYSSSNYNLLAAVIEKVAGQSFPEAVQRMVFNPLKLSHTGFDNVLRPLRHRARRYSFYDPWTYEESQELHIVPVWDYSFNMGGGNIISTATDLAKFASALAKPGLLTLDEMELLYDESWFGKRDERGRQFIYVTGANPGVQAALVVYRDSNVVAVVLSNTWGVGSRSGDMVELAKKLAGMCMAE